MARNRKGSDTSVLDAPSPSTVPTISVGDMMDQQGVLDAPDHTNGSPTPAPAPAPTPDGTQPAPQPTQTQKRKPRNPDSLRPIYMLAGQERGTGALRVLMVRPTIGQARKAMADVQQMGGRDYDGYIIFRCKAVE